MNASTYECFMLHQLIMLQLTNASRCPVSYLHASTSKNALTPPGPPPPRPPQNRLIYIPIDSNQLQGSEYEFFIGIDMCVQKVIILDASCLGSKNYSATKTMGYYDSVIAA